MPSDAQLWRHNLTEDEFYEILEGQDSRCAVCDRDDKRLVIDHAHECCNGNSPDQRSCGFCVRGFVCHRCNNLLGNLETSGPVAVMRAIRYISGENPRRRLPSSMEPTLLDHLTSATESLANVS